MKLAKKANAIFDTVLNVTIVLAIVSLIFPAVSVSSDVALRNIFNHPIKGIMEISEWCLLSTTFLGAAWVLKREGHVKMDLLVNRLKPKAGALLHCITSYLCAAAMLVVTIFGAETTWDTFQRDLHMVGTLELPVPPITAIVTVGSLLLFIQFLRRGSGYWQSHRLLSHQHEGE